MRIGPVAVVAGLLVTGCAQQNQRFGFTVDGAGENAIVTYVMPPDAPKEIPREDRFFWQRGAYASFVRGCLSSNEGSARFVRACTCIAHLSPAFVPRQEALLVAANQRSGVRKPEETPDFAYLTHFCTTH